MDQTEDDIRQNIRDTRTSMTEKLEMLEERVQETIEGARTTVEDIVGNVKGTVDTTVEIVKDTVDDTVEKVKRTFDFQYQVDRHPWLMFGGAILVGLTLGSMGRRRSMQSSSQTDGAAMESARERLGGYPEVSRASQPQQEGVWAGLRHQMRNETGVLLSATLTGLTEMLRGTLREALPRLTPYLEQKGTRPTGGVEHQSSQPSDPNSPVMGRAASSPGVSRSTEPTGERHSRPPSPGSITPHETGTG